jgi:hypothetical protein
MSIQEQTLWDRISQVADYTRELPDWKKGSSLNERDETSSREQAPQRALSLTAPR